MRSPRNVLKTIRIPEETVEVINNFEGSTWNDKINNFLDFYIQNEFEYKKYLKELELQIQDKQQLLDDFKLKISKFQDLLK